MAMKSGDTTASWSYLHRVLHKYSERGARGVLEGDGEVEEGDADGVEGDGSGVGGNGHVGVVDRAKLPRVVVFVPD